MIQYSTSLQLKIRDMWPVMQVALLPAVGIIKVGEVKSFLGSYWGSGGSCRRGKSGRSVGCEADHCKKQKRRMTKWA